MHNTTLIAHPYGFFLVPRRWRECFDASSSKTAFSKPEAWLYLLERAAFVDTEMVILGRKILVLRGQAVLSVRYLAQAWNWGKDKVATFLDELEALKVITLCDLGQRTDRGFVKRQTRSARLPRIISFNNYNNLQTFKARGFYDQSDKALSVSDQVFASQSDEVKEEKNKKQKEYHTRNDGQVRLQEWFREIEDAEGFEESLPASWRNVAIDELGVNDEELGYTARAFWERYASTDPDRPELSWNWYGTWVKFLRRVKGYRT